MKTNFPMYCFDFETLSSDKKINLNCIKIIKKDCSVLLRFNNVCLPTYNKGNKL